MRFWILSAARGCHSDVQSSGDDIFGNLVQPLVVSARVVAEPGEGLIHGHPAGLRDNSLRLFDHDTAVQRDLQLLRHEGALADRALVQDADGRDIRQRAR